MKDTYLRPRWKAFLIYLLVSLGVWVGSLLMILLLGVGVSSMSWVTQTIDGTVFGTVPVWVPMAFAFGVLSPFLGFVMYWGMVPHKYQKEQHKGLLPVDKREPRQVLFSPRKNLSSGEPGWIDNFEFTATVHIVGTQNLDSGRGTMTWVVLEDENGYKYLIRGARFNDLLEKMTDSKYTGKFTFDTTWVYPSIKEV